MTNKDLEEIKKEFESIASEESIKALNDALEAGKTSEPPEEVVNSAALQVEDMMPMADQYLGPNAKEALNKKSTSLTVTEDGKTYQCLHLGVRVLKTNLEAGVKKLSEVLNDLAIQGLIHSALAPMSSIELNRGFGEKATVAVFSHVLVPLENHEELSRDDFAVKEYGYHKTLDDIKEELADGEFLAEIRLNHTLFMMSGTTARVVEEVIDEYLAVLPKGTKVVSTERLPMACLSVDYEVKFYNPLMKSIKRVELRHMRMAECIEEGRVEHFQLLTGVDYFDKDGNNRFPLGV